MSFNEQQHELYNSFISLMKPHRETIISHNSTFNFVESEYYLYLVHAFIAEETKIVIVLKNQILNENHAIFISNVSDKEYLKAQIINFVLQAYEGEDSRFYFKVFKSIIDEVTLRLYELEILTKN